MAMDMLWPAKVAYVVFGIACYMLYFAVKGISGRPQLLSYGRYLVYRLLWSLFAMDPNRNLLRADPTTTLDSFRTYGKNTQRNVEDCISSLDFGAKLVWLGPQKADKIVYYCHGGGYASCAASGHFRLLEQIISEARGKGHIVTVAMLVYDLSPKGSYPKQLQQVMAGLSYLLNNCAYKASDVIIAGDSAGGHLVLSLLSHLLHKHPSVDRSSILDSRFAGIFLLSPWVTFEQDSVSMAYNQDTDFVNKRSLRCLSSSFMATAAVDNYNHPLHADAEWWTDLPCQRFGIVCGSYEIFRDDVRELAGKLEHAHPSLDFAEISGEIHVQSVVNLTAGWKTAESQTLFTNWIMQAFSGA